MNCEAKSPTTPATDNTATKRPRGGDTTPIAIAAPDRK